MVNLRKIREVKLSRLFFLWTSLVAQTVKRLPTIQESRGSVPGSGRSPGEGNGNPLQYSSWKIPGSW